MQKFKKNSKIFWGCNPTPPWQELGVIHCLHHQLQEMLRAPGSTVSESTKMHHFHVKNSKILGRVGDTHSLQPSPLGAFGSSMRAFGVASTLHPQLHILLGQVNSPRVMESR